MIGTFSTEKSGSHFREDDTVGKGEGTHLTKMFDTPNALINWLRRNPDASPDLRKEVLKYLEDILAVIDGR